jgi:hypothetical protein
MIAVRHLLVPASGPMHVGGVMPAATMLRSALVRICRGDLDHVFIDMIVMHVVKMSVMQVVNVIPMLDGSMTAAGTVHVRVVAMLRIWACHGLAPSLVRTTPPI